MNNIIFYGNCHGVALETILKSSEEFSNKYTITKFVAHQAPNEDLANMMENLCPKADVVIYQSILDNYRGPQFGSNKITELEGPHKIKLTNAYYAGYNPEIGYIYDNGKHYEKNGVSLQDNCLFYRWMWKMGGIKDLELERYGWDPLPLLNPNFYKYEYSLQEHFLSLAQLEWRDEIFRADITVSDYIRRNYTKERLFHTLNHPCLNLMYYEARQIMELLDLDPNTLAQKNTLRDPFDFLIFPIYTATKNNLSLEFDCPLIYKHNNVLYNPEEFVTLSFNYYNSMPCNLRDKNLKLSLNRKISFEATANKKTNKKNLCVICFANKADIVILQCRHLITCKECIMKISKCPICRIDFQNNGIIQVFS